MSDTYDGVKTAIKELVAQGIFDPNQAVKDATKEHLAENATLRSQLSEAREALDGLLKAFRSTTEYHHWGDDAEDFAFMERRGKFLGWEVFDPKGRVRGYIAAVRALSKLPSSKKQGEPCGCMKRGCTDCARAIVSPTHPAECSGCGKSHGGPACDFSGIDPRPVEKGG